MGETPAWQSLTVWYGVACPLDGWGPPREYGDSLTRVTGLEESFQSLRLVRKSRDYGQQRQRVPGHCCAVRNTSGTAAKPELSSVKELTAAREGNAVESFMLASDLAGRLDTGDGEMEVLTYPFLRLGGQKKKRSKNVESREDPESEEEENITKETEDASQAQALIENGDLSPIMWIGALSMSRVVIRESSAL